MKLLDAYKEEGLEELKRRTGKRRTKRTRQIKKEGRRSHKKMSRTDLESGYMKRPGNPSDSITFLTRRPNQTIGLLSL